MVKPRFLLAIAVLAAAGQATPASHRTSYALTFEDRIRAQEAIERVYHSYRIDAPDFERAVPRALLERKVQRVLRLSTELEQRWHTPVTAEALDRELARLERATRFPDRLAAIYDALGNDPLLIRETFARATLVERLARSFLANEVQIPADENGGVRTGLQLRISRLDGTAPGATVSEPDAQPPGDTDRIQGGIRSTLREDGPAAVCEVSDLWHHEPGYGVPQARTGFTTVWTGSEMIIWGGDDVGVNLEGGRYDPLTDTWSLTSVVGAPTPRTGHTAVWTGREMIIWGGGGGGTPSNTGGRYDPVADTWSPTTLVNAPSSRRSHTAVWTGREMIVWGGWDLTDTGGRYDPNTDTWTPTSLVDAPAPRQEHFAVWTGSEMIVWGGGTLISGGRYDPESDAWSPTSLTGAPPPRMAQSVVWTGHEMIVWGGFFGGVLPIGGRYEPDSDSWSPTTLVGAPSNRSGHSAVWTGSRMIVWGGIDASGAGSFALNTGGVYDPGSDTWAPTSLAGAPAPRQFHGAVWSGDRMIVWGGTTGNTGGRYDPATGTWTPTSTDSPVPSLRREHSAVWTGAELIVWGGEPGPVATGARWDALTGEWTPTSMTGAPAARLRHTAVWSGSEMIVWGGLGKDAPNMELGDGARYDPVADAWTPVTTVGAPSPRSLHAAVWTGREMIVWGGDGSWFNGGERSDGARYDPALDAWTGMTDLDAPSPRESPAAVWTGSEMIVTGGGSGDRPARYDPQGDSWTPTSAIGAPTSRYSTAVWTGREMIVWGGNLGINTGSRYDPLADTWTPTSTAGAPGGRVFHTAIWTGKEMIVWGGFRVLSFFPTLIPSYDTGGRYDPVTDSWVATSVVHAPDPRFGHTVVWTGAAMIPWGGSAYSADLVYGVVQGHVAWYGGSLFPPQDTDGDGYTACDGDCDDTDDAVHPGAVDLPGNARDEDCRAGPSCDPAAAWGNQGQFLSCVAQACNRLVAEGSVTIQECSRIVAGAARGARRRNSHP